MTISVIGWAGVGGVIQTMTKGDTMSETPAVAPGADEGQGEDVDPVQTGAPATGPEAPTPPFGADDADD